MKLESVGAIIARRDFELVDGNSVNVLVGVPDRFPDSEHDYYCPYQILGLQDERVRYAAGIDSIQAIMLALERIGIDLYTSEEYKDGRLKSQSHKKGDLGFPLPDGLSDIRNILD